MKILVCSDFHGNDLHAQKCAAAVEMCSPDIFIYLGDLSPIRSKYATHDSAGRYVEKRIFPYFESLCVQHKFVMCGNTDFKPCIDKWCASYRSEADGFVFVKDAKFCLKGFNLMFLSTTEASPHALKDCEALGRGPAPHIPEFVFSGRGAESFKTVNGLEYSRDFIYYKYLEDVPENLAAEFKRTIFSRLQALYDDERTNILFSHSPPFGCCDETPRRHAGSRDIRDFLENYPIEACFAGHIHSGVDICGKYREELNGCSVMCPGGSGIDEQYLNKVHFVNYDTDTKQSERFGFDVGDFDLCFRRYQ